MDLDSGPSQLLLPAPQRAHQMQKAENCIMDFYLQYTWPLKYLLPSAASKTCGLVDGDTDSCFGFTQLRPYHRPFVQCDSETKKGLNFYPLAMKVFAVFRSSFASKLWLVPWFSAWTGCTLSLRGVQRSGKSGTGGWSSMFFFSWHVVRPHEAVLLVRCGRVLTGHRLGYARRWWESAGFL